MMLRPPADSMLDLIGRTPIVSLENVVPDGSARVAAKLESFNPAGSVKDRIGLYLIRAGEASGRLQPGGTIVEPTSGNTGVGLAVAASVLGYRLVCTLPDKVPREKIALLEAYGVETHVCPTDVDADDPRSYYSVARRIEKERAAYRPDQYSNPANPQAHFETTGPEIWNDTDGTLAAFVCGIGTGGTITGTGRYLKSRNPGVQVVGVDTEGSILRDAWQHDGKFDTKPHGYLIDGIGEDFVPANVDLELIDDVITVSDAQAYTMAMRLAREEGLLVGSSAGAAVVGAIEVARRLSPDDLVVTLLPDSGERYLSKLNPQWLSEHGLLEQATPEV